MDEPSAAPGWYADPTKRQEYRYWDGSIWKADVADAGQTTVDPLNRAAAKASAAQLASRGMVPRSTPMTESDKAFMIDVAVAILFPPWILVVLAWWLLYRRPVPSPPRYRRALGTTIMVGAGLYATFAVLMLSVSLAAKQPTVAPETPRRSLNLQTPAMVSPAA